MLPHEHMERWMAERLLRHVEPRIALWMREFLESDEGKDILADAFSDVLVDILVPTTAHDNNSFMEDTLLRVVEQMARRPEFRQRLTEILEPGTPARDPSPW